MNYKNLIAGLMLSSCIGTVAAAAEMVRVGAVPFKAEVTGILVNDLPA